MKKNCLFIFVVLLTITSCQVKPKTVAIDLNAEKAVIDSLFDKFYGAFNAKDAATLGSCLTEDALCCGTDPSEFWNKQQMTEMWSQMLADSVPELTFINERVIKVANDGNSAIAVEQYLLPGVTPIPWRNSYHLVKLDNEWKILFLNCGFIPKNEDIPKLSASLQIK